MSGAPRGPRVAGQAPPPPAAAPAARAPAATAEASEVSESASATSGPMATSAIPPAEPTALGGWPAPAAAAGLPAPGATGWAAALALAAVSSAHNMAVGSLPTAVPFAQPPGGAAAAPGGLGSFGLGPWHLPPPQQEQAAPGAQAAQHQAAPGAQAAQLPAAQAAPQQAAQVVQAIQQLLAQAAGGGASGQQAQSWLQAAAGQAGWPGVQAQAVAAWQLAGPGQVQAPPQVAAQAQAEEAEAAEEEWGGSEEEEEEEERRAGRRTLNRLAAARYRQRQKAEEQQLVAQLAAGAEERVALQAERHQLAVDRGALLGWEAVQHDLHTCMQQLGVSGSSPFDVAVASAQAMQPAALPAALALAAGSGSAAAGGSGNATGVAAAAGAGPAGGAAPEAAGSAADAARLVASMEREFAAELDQVVQAEDPKAAADAVLQLLPPDVHPVLDASAAAFVEQVKQMQRSIQALVSAAQREYAGGGGHQPPAIARAVEQCALLRKLLLALSLARPDPDKLLRLIATSAEAPPGTWERAAEALRPSLTAEQLAGLHAARQTWVRTMGPLLAARGAQLSRLESLQAALVALRAGGEAGPAEEARWTAVADAAGALALPPSGQGQQGGAGEGVHGGGLPAAGQGSPSARELAAAMQVSADVAARDYTGMWAAAQEREQLQRELRHLSDSYKRGWTCLVRFLLQILQTISLLQCSLMLSACAPHFPDLVQIACVLLEGQGPAQPVQLQQVAEQVEGQEQQGQQEQDEQAEG